MPNTDRPKKPLKHICFADIDGKESIVILAGGRDPLVAVAPIDDKAPGRAVCSCRRSIVNQAKHVCSLCVCISSCCSSAAGTLVHFPDKLTTWGEVTQPSVSTSSESSSSHADHSMPKLYVLLSAFRQLFGRSLTFEC